MMNSHTHPDMIALKARFNDIDRGFQPKSREYGKSELSVGGRVASAIASIAAISIVVSQTGLLG